VLGTCVLTSGMQNSLGGFLLAIVSGNNAELVQAPAIAAEQAIDQVAAKPADLQPVRRAG
jgi:hypothetical protein